MRKLLIAGMVAVIASLAFSSVASAHTLRYSTAKNLATKLAKQHERTDPVRSWRLGGADRISDHLLVFGYSVAYDDGRRCTADIDVRYTTKSNGKPIVKAIFTNVDCPS